MAWTASPQEPSLPSMRYTDHSIQSFKGSSMACLSGTIETLQVYLYLFLDYTFKSVKLLVFQILTLKG